MIRLTYLVTDPMSARLLLRGQLRRMQQRGFDVRLGCGQGRADVERVSEREGVPVTRLPLRREIAPFADLRALIKTASWFAATRPHLVNAGTPKAGLVGMLAARLARVPVRIYTLHGLRLETARGLKQRLLAAAERAAVRSSHQVVAVGPSLARRAEELGLHDGPVDVLRPWSANGIDVDGLHAASAGPREAARRQLGIPSPAVVLGFVGRLTRDKGLADLLQVFDRVRAERPETRLLLLGSFESGDPVEPTIVERVRSDEAIHWAGFARETARHYAAMDCLVFPSYREGLPLVPLEAAACGVPVTGYAATGTVDAVEHGVTGMLVRTGDAEALARTTIELLGDPAALRRAADAGRERVSRLFRREHVWDAIEHNYRRLLQRAGIACPAPGTAADAERRIS